MSEFDAGPGHDLHVLQRPRGQPDHGQLVQPATVRAARANDANLVRQRDKIVTAINTADADIVSLEELENSVQLRQATVTSRSTRWSPR